MDLDNFQSIINATIVKRGLNYFNKNYVEGLAEILPGVWRSVIQGSDLYEIEITLNEQDIRDYSCTCPYNGVTCKHVVATLYGIQGMRNFYTQNSNAQNRQIEPKTVTKINKSLIKQDLSEKDPSKLTQLDNVLKKVSHKEVVDFVRDLIKDDRKLLDKTLLNFQSYTGLTQVANIRCRAQFNAIINIYSDRGMIDYRASKGFGRDTHAMIETLVSSCMSSHIFAIEGVESCFEILKILMNKVVTIIDDSNGELGSICISLADLLTHLYPLLSKEQQAESFQKILHWQFDNELTDYGLDQYFDELAPTWAMNNSKFQDIYLKAINKALVSPRYNWQVEALNRTKLEQLSLWGRTEEAEALSKEKIEIPEFREIAINKAIKSKDFEMARSLTNEGIKLAKQKKHPGVVAMWREVLLKIAIKTSDVDAIRTELLKILEDSWIDIKKYRQLKATYDTNEWQQVQEKTAKRILKKYNAPYAWAEIYAEENQLRKLFDLIQSDEYEASSLFKKHLKILAKEFPEESANFYAIIIHHELEQSDKKVYQQAVKDIKVLQKLPMGEAIAKQLIIEATEKYKNRPTMLDIFKRAFGENN